jgi:pseudouridine-5'-phosphate glycosidase
MSYKQYLQLSEEVRRAREEDRPIVALESTIISHGMTYPQNISMATEVEGIIREEGATPATIAIIDGKIKIGLAQEEIELLATRKDIAKVSRRDLPYLVSSKMNGATTVAATMICARLAGVEVFVTGGIGGVHREAENTMDVSADLQELANTNVAVVCAGAKSILDIGLTLEYLETHGVPIIGYKTNIFPAFYSPTSAFQVDYRMDQPAEVARMIRTKWDLGLQGGVVVANPVPEDEALEEERINSIIVEALHEATEKRISGKRVTPFLLDKVKQLTMGESLQTNIALVKHNARVGAKVAVQLHST